MNIHYPTRTAFLHSEDASAEKHDANYIFQFVDKAIKDVGPNVIQIVTDNASNDMAAANIMQLKRPSIFWTSCAAHVRGHSQDQTYSECYCEWEIRVSFHLQPHNHP